VARDSHSIGTQRCDRLGRAQRELLGHQLADDQRGIGGENDNERESRLVGGALGNAEQRQPFADRRAEARARIGARQDADQGDADLDGRKKLARIAGQLERGACATLVIARHRLQPRLA
jgi:hypothetical protein